MEVERRQIRRALRATVVALLALWLASSPALAQQHRFVDPVHDVAHQPERGDPEPAPHRRDVDIRETIIRHGPDRVAIRVHVRDLKVRRFSMRGEFFHNLTREATVYPDLEVRWHPDHPHRADVYIDWDLPNCWKGAEPEEGGDGIRLHTNYRTNNIHLSFPVSCISPDRDPRWIRAYLRMSSGLYPTRGLYADEVSYPGRYPDYKSLGPVSPRVYAAKE